MRNKPLKLIVVFIITFLVSSGFNYVFSDDKNLKREIVCFSLPLGVSMPIAMSVSSVIGGAAIAGGIVLGTSLTCDFLSNSK